MLINIKMMEVIGNYKDLLSTKDFNKLFELVKFYRIPFLNMWYDSYMSFNELKNEMDQLDKGFEVELRKGMNKW